MAISDIIYNLQALGITDVFIPFMLVFTITFAILQKVHIFGANAGATKKFDSIIAMMLAIGVVVPHVLNQYPPGTDVVQILNSALPNISLLIVGAVILMILLAMFGAKLGGENSSFGGFFTLIILGVIIYIFGNAAGMWDSYLLGSAFSDPDVQATIIILGVFFFVITTITKDENDKENFGKNAGEFFGFRGAPPAGGK